MASGTVSLFAYQFVVLRGHAHAGLGLWAELFVASLVLLVVQVLGVYKPKGMTAYGRRKYQPL